MTWIAVVAAGAGLSYLIVLLTLPVLKRHAVAALNERSSHQALTPQGGGFAVVLSTILVGGLAVLMAGGEWQAVQVLALSVVALASLGALDDISPLPVLPRLVVQFASVGALCFLADPEMRVFPGFLDFHSERGLLVVAILWFVNLTNFMDGLDWLTVGAFIPICASLVIFGAMGFTDAWVALVAAALLGGLLGFAPFNKPTARLFLGDVGALPIGLLVGWMLYDLAGCGGLAAALILPLYHVSDASLTIVSRLLAGERLWEAHRTHFYQQANRNGMSAQEVSGHVFVLNCALAVLAAATLLWGGLPIQIGALALAVVLVVLTLARFVRLRRDSGSA